MDFIGILKNVIILIILLCASKHDCEQQRIPTVYSIGLMVLGIVDRLVKIVKIGNVAILLLMPAMVIMLFYALIYAVSSGGLGGGDIKLLMGLGLCIGLWNSIDCFVIAALLFVAMRLMEAARLRMITGETHPFAPYILMAYIAKICFK